LGAGNRRLAVGSLINIYGTMLTVAGVRKRGVQKLINEKKKIIREIERDEEMNIKVRE
jgi:hypothetical protein